MGDIGDIGMTAGTQKRSVDGMLKFFRIDVTFKRGIPVTGETVGVRCLCLARGDADQTRQSETGKQDPA